MGSLNVVLVIVFVPLNRMPLNPNGKIDKPALPFPDTAHAASAPLGPPSSNANPNSTLETMRSIWSSILPNAPSPIPTDESFFDLGGHSILATRLIFEIRKVFVINAPLGLVFDKPTLGALVAAVDAIRNADLGLAYKDPNGNANGLSGVPGQDGSSPVAVVEYGKDYESLLPRLQKSYPRLSADFATRPLTVFLTGATGFLGAFVLHNLLAGQQNRVGKVVCLVRAPDAGKGLERLREGSSDRQVWDEKWVQDGRLEVVIGDLGQELFGLGKDNWDRLTAEADVILHNGALVRCGCNVAKANALTLLFLGPLGVPL